MGQSNFRRFMVVSASLFLFAWSTAPARAEDPVDELRAILGDRSKIGDAGGAESLEYRRTKVKQSIDRMKSIGQLRRALILDEWKVDPKRVVNEKLREVDVEMRKLVGDRLSKSLSRMARKGDANARLAVANTIAEMGPTIRPLDSDDRNGYARTLTPIVVHLCQDEDLGVRQESLRALSNINAVPKEAANVFRIAMQKDGEVGPKRLAADGLQQLIKVVNFLQRRGQAASGVEALRSDLLDVLVAVGPVAAIAVEDSDTEVRMLGLMAVQASAQSLADLMDIPEDYHRKDFPPVGRKLSVAEKDRIVKVYDAVQKDYDEVKSVLEMLKKAMPTYGKTLYDGDARVRLASVQAFDNLANARLRLVRRAINLPTLRDLKGTVERSPQTLLQGTDFLAAFFARDLPQIAALLRDPDVRIRRAAAEVCEELEEKMVPILPALVAALCDSDRFVRWTAAKAAANLPADQADPVILPLGKLLSDPDLNLRIAAATSLEALAKVAAPAGPMLAQAIRTGDVEARLAAMYALIKMGPEYSQQAIPALVQALGSSEPRVLKQACEVLADIGPAAAPALPALRRLIGNEDAEVRSGASDAILSILREE